MRLVNKAVTVTVGVFLFSLSLYSQTRLTPTITFINQSGENCVVKLVGPTGGYIRVPQGTRQSISSRGGRYYILTRYGEPGHFRYTRGETFLVTETNTSVSRISITLHKVVGSNYETQPDSGREF